MKELTTEEKAKRYDDASKEVKDFFEGKQKMYSDVTQTLEYLFPELKESEDERIKNEIINFIKDNTLTYTKSGSEIQMRWVAWLEKQGERKLAELPKGEDYGIDGLWHAISILKRTLGEVDGYQSDDGILEHKCAISAVKELYERKPAWSEEDVYNAERLLCLLTNEQDNYPQLSCDFQEIGGIKDWVESLKDRVQPQAKQEWSEEDEDMFNEIKTALNGFYCEGNAEELTNWLKSLKERVGCEVNCTTTWKPSNMQMKLRFGIRTKQKQSDR